MIWIQVLIHKTIPLGTRTIRFQANEFYECLDEKDETKECFFWSKRQFEIFKHRYGLHNMKFSGTFESFEKIFLYWLILAHNRRKRIGGL